MFNLDLSLAVGPHKLIYKGKMYIQGQLMPLSWAYLSLKECTCTFLSVHNNNYTHFTYWQLKSVKKSTKWRKLSHSFVEIFSTMSLPISISCSPAFCKIQLKNCLINKGKIILHSTQVGQMILEFRCVSNGSVSKHTRLLYKTGTVN